MPHYKHGTLQEFMIEQRCKDDYLQAAHLFSYAIDVVQAMTFLHSQQVGIAWFGSLLFDRSSVECVYS